MVVVRKMSHDLQTVERMKALKIHLISAALPPQRDGIGDYTACLAAEMAHSAAVTVLTGAENPTPICGAVVKTAFSAQDPASVRRIAEFIAADKPDWALLQYNPFCYGRWGLNLHLPETMRRLRQVSPGTRVAVMVHEPFVPIITPQFAVMSTWQRWQLWRLGQDADVLFYSIDAWRQRFERWFPGKPAVHLPVGSNIPYTPMCRAEARARLGIHEGAVVLGLFGTAGSGRMLGRVKEALVAVRAAGIPAQALYVGPDSVQICAALAGTGIIAEGPFPAEEVSRRLAAMDIYLAAYVDGISTRRGAFMAALQHGIATVGTRGPLTDAILEQEDQRAFLLTAIDNPDAFTAAVVGLAENASLRQRFGQEAQKLYKREFTWQKTAARLLSAMQAPCGS